MLLLQKCIFFTIPVQRQVLWAQILHLYDQCRHQKFYSGSHSAHASRWGWNQTCSSRKSHLCSSWTRSAANSKWLWPRVLGSCSLENKRSPSRQCLFILGCLDLTVKRPQRTRQGHWSDSAALTLNKTSVCIWCAFLYCFFKIMQIDKCTIYNLKVKCMSPKCCTVLLPRNKWHYTCKFKMSGTAVWLGFQLQWLTGAAWLHPGF